MTQATQAPTAASLRDAVKRAERETEDARDDYHYAAGRNDHDELGPCWSTMKRAEDRLEKAKAALAENVAHVTAAVAKMDADQTAGY